MSQQETKQVDSKVLTIAVLVLGIGTILLGGFFGIVGVILVYLGAKGTTHISIFNSSFETTNVGVGALCVAAVIVIAMLIRVSSVLKTSGGSTSTQITKTVKGRGTPEEGETEHF